MVSQKKKKKIDGITGTLKQNHMNSSKGIIGMYYYAIFSCGVTGTGVMGKWFSSSAIIKNTSYRNSKRFSTKGFQFHGRFSNGIR